MNHFSRCFFALVVSAGVQGPALFADDANAPAAAALADNSAPAANAPTADTPTGAINDASATFQTFYDGLACEGTWIQTQQYGYVWQPQVTDPNWAPYTDGYWAYTQQGWTWVSNEAWGWATYHYGRWANLENVGWVWVPGYVWAPAWVSWRDGGGYVGWAPLPPDSMVGTDYASNTGETPTTNPPDMGDNSNDVAEDYHIGSDVDDYYDIGPGWYIFIPIGFFCDHHHHDHYCPHADNFWIADQTRNVTNVNVTHKAGAGRFDRVSVGGPSLAEVNAGSSTPIEKSTLGLATQPGGGTASGNTLSFYAPHIHASTTAAPLSVGMSVVQSSVNHGIEVTRPLAVNSSLVPTNPTAEQIAKAGEAQNSAPAGSKVLTDSSMIKPFEHPTFSNLRPIGATRTTSFTGGAGPSPGGNIIAPTGTFSQTGRTSFNTPPSTQSTSNQQQHTVTQGAGNPYTRTPAPSTSSPSSGQNYSGESHEYHAAPSSGQSSPYTTYNSDGTQNSTTTSSPSGSGPASSAPASGGMSTHH